jgi:hypothetical protein
MGSIQITKQEYDIARALHKNAATSVSEDRFGIKKYSSNGKYCNAVHVSVQDGAIVRETYSHPELNIKWVSERRYLDRTEYFIKK